MIVSSCLAGVDGGSCKSSGLRFCINSALLRRRSPAMRTQIRAQERAHAEGDDAEDSGAGARPFAGLAE